MHMSRADLAALRARLWHKLQPALARTPALADCSGRALDKIPVTEMTAMRADYGAWNSLGISDAVLRDMADAAEQGKANGALSAGWSSGTSGAERGLFLTSPAERADYIGQSLARLLPARALLRRQRLAVHLRASNALYSHSERGRFAFAHFPLQDPIDQTISAIGQFRPTILVAPPHRLIAFAKAGPRMPFVQHLFCGSEPISEAESAFTANQWGRRPRAIYQATEGFLGAECAYGRLHLNDHSLEIELAPVQGTQGYRPIITDLRRVSQPIVRLRGDDYLELDPRPCTCGFAGRVIHAPQGRVGDIWRVNDRAITPPQVVRAIEAVLGGEEAWRIEANPAGARLHVSPTCAPALAEAAAQNLIRGEDLPITVQIIHDLATWDGPKRRKVVWHHG